jgi:acetylornithine deacetylase/succinyl-diaminopimelate desuccinylase-like protein
MDINDYADQLAPFIKIKSISTDRAYKEEIQQAVAWLEAYFEKNGFTKQTYSLESNNPLVFAEYTVSPKLPTILIYGHYDVVPVTDSKMWDSDPFELFSRGDRLYGRGISDNKGQTFIHLHTISKLINTYKLAWNVKVLLEGNEETGNSELAEFIQNNGELLKSDYVLVSDGPAIKNVPTLEASLRAAYDITLTLTTGKRVMHDGLFGGAVPNAAHEAANLISKFNDANNQIQIEGMYEEVDPISKTQKELAEELIEDETEFAKEIGVKSLVKPDSMPFYTQTGLQPSLQVSGMKAGYTKQGYGGIIPHEAVIKLNLRMVQSQEPSRVIELFNKFVAEQLPNYVEYSIDYEPANQPVKIDINKPIFKHVQDLVVKAYGDRALIRYVGGSIPVVADFQHLLKTDSIVLSLGNEDSNIHGPNENMTKERIINGLKFSRLFFSTSFTAGGVR